MTENYKCQTPVALIIFNRPGTTQKVFQRIVEARPSKLLVIADGPRTDRPGETEKCAAARAIIQQVNWDCEVLTNFSDVNMGCKHRVSSGLDWVFKTVEEAIVLEDDCLPDPSFFRYCDELLEFYRDDQRVAVIGGSNFQFGHVRTPYSYYFSRYNHVWGWAGWRRAWKHYDVHLTRWPEIRSGGWLMDYFGNSRQVGYWTRIYDLVHQGEIDTWDYQWTFACWLQNGLTVLPNVNLISNIGFGADATHPGGTNRVANIPTVAMEFPLKPPPFIIRDSDADARTDKLFFDNSLLIRAKLLARNWLW